MNTGFKLLTILLVFLFSMACTRNHKEGTAIINQFGYKNCIELKTSKVRVVLEPNMGGRILAYELNGKNAVYRNPLQDGIIYNPEVGQIDPTGGRFDIGPEKISPKHPALFLGKWN